MKIAVFFDTEMLDLVTPLTLFFSTPLSVHHTNSELKLMKWTHILHFTDFILFFSRIELDSINVLLLFLVHFVPCSTLKSAKNDKNPKED